MTDTAELERLAASITPGPWSTDGLSFTVTTGAIGLPHGRTFGHGCGNNFICDLNDGEYHEYTDEEEQEANARAIALVPDLLAEVTALRAEIARLTAERDQALSHAAAAAMEMRDTCSDLAYDCDWYVCDPRDLAAEINKLPLDPDAQKALDKMLAKAREDAIREAVTAIYHKPQGICTEGAAHKLAQHVRALLNDGGRDE